MQYDQQITVEQSDNGPAELDLGGIERDQRNVDILVEHDGEVEVSGQWKWRADYFRCRAADDADPTFVVDQGLNDFLFSFTGVAEDSRFVFEGVDIDMTADDTAVGIRAISREQLRITDVEFLGRGTYPDEDIVMALNVGITNPDKGGTVKNVTAKKGSTWARYKQGSGRTFAWVGDAHKGLIEFRGCHAEEFGNNAIYGSQAPGNIHVVDCEFWNNNVAAVRCGKDGDLVKDTVMGIDPDRYQGPREDDHESVSWFMRGIWEEVKVHATEFSGRLRVDGCEIKILHDGPLPTGAYGIRIRPNGGAMDVTDTTIEVTADDATAISAAAPGPSGPHAQPDGPTDLTIESTRVTSPSNGNRLVYIDSRDVAVGDECCLESTGTRDGLFFRGESTLTIGESTVNVNGEPILGVDCDRSKMDTEKSCGLRPPLDERGNDTPTPGSPVTGIDPPASDDSPSPPDRTDTSHTMFAPPVHRITLTVSEENSPGKYIVSAVDGGHIEFTPPEDQDVVSEDGLTADGAVWSSGQDVFEVRGAVDEIKAPREMTAQIETLGLDTDPVEVPLSEVPEVTQSRAFDHVMATLRHLWRSTTGY